MLARAITKEGTVQDVGSTNERPPIKLTDRKGRASRPGVVIEERSVARGALKLGQGEVSNQLREDAVRVVGHRPGRDDVLRNGEPGALVAAKRNAPAP